MSPPSFLQKKAEGGGTSEQFFCQNFRYFSNKKIKKNFFFQNLFEKLLKKHVSLPSVFVANIKSEKILKKKLFSKFFLEISIKKHVLPPLFFSKKKKFFKFLKKSKNQRGEYMKNFLKILKTKGGGDI